MKRKKRLLKGIESLDERIEEHLEKAGLYESQGRGIDADYARKEAERYMKEREKKKRKL